MGLDHYRQQQIAGLDTEQKCWRLYVDNGWTVRQIGLALEMSPSGVARALKRAEKRGLEALAASVSAEKALALARLHRIFEIAMDAYAGSVSERTRRRSKRRVGGKAGNVDETEIISEARLGNPRYLTVALGAVAEICKLLGLNAPTKVSAVDPDRPFEHMSDDEVRRELVLALRQAGVDATMLNADPVGDGEKRH